MMSRCPKCKLPTARVEYEGVRVRMCGRCGGYWLKPVALKAIANRRDTEFTEIVQERFLQIAEESDSKDELLCLSCGKHMIKEHFKEWDDIVIDRCPKCGGIWLDPGELEKIQIYWEYFQDHPEQSNMDALAKKALLAERLAQRGRDVKEAADTIATTMRYGGYSARYRLRAAMGTLFRRG